MEERMGKAGGGRGMKPRATGFGSSTPPVLSLYVLSLCVSSSVRWTVQRIGGGCLVSWLPWQLQQGTNVPVLCGGAKGLR